MEHIFTYNKSFQDRLREFQNVLGGSKLHSVTDIKKEWSIHLELTMDSGGWQAIWKIPRLLCEELNIEYPSRVLGYVHDIDFNELKATVCVLSVPGRVELPSRYIVPLIQLSITKEQDKSVGLNLEATANCLDMLTFFYTHVVMPWDYYDDDVGDWLSKHLEARLHLFYDMMHHTISKNRIDKLEYLLNTARRLLALRTNLELKLEDAESGRDVENLLDIHVSLSLIRGKVELLADPLFQNTDMVEVEELHIRNGTSPINWIVFQRSDTIDDQLTLLTLIEEDILPDSNICPVSNIMEVLESVNSGDSIYFNKGVYEIEDTFLPNDVGMQGLYPLTETVISSSNAEILLNCNGNLILENLTIDVKTAQCGILVCSGLVELKNCKIIGDGKTSTHRGIIALGDSKLRLINCSISHFYTAIIGYSLSSITLQNCKISNVTQGIKMFDKCKLEANDLLFSSCKDYGIWFETNNLLDEGVFQQCSFSSLETIPEITLQNVTSELGGKEDVMIMHKPQLKPILDLFSNPDLDPTIIHNELDDELNSNI